MNTNSNAEVNSPALVAAQALKEKLEARLIGKTAEAWNCDCGACSAGPSSIVEISLPTKRDNTARWTAWECQMEDNTGKRWSHMLCQFISWSELYPMFRQAFAGMGLEMAHTSASVYYDSQPATFTSSGYVVELTNNSPVFVRPVGDLGNSVWSNAELRIDSHMYCYETDEAMIACNVDALELGQRQGRCEGIYYRLVQDAGEQTFYIKIPDDALGEYVYIPIGRVVQANKHFDTVRLELAQDIEVFVPVYPT